uniref:Uncharacterized protein n=1 Tax=Heterorhabditis bacteriophora TaxID=37862 RepID=A0A1I7WKM9_HETBA
MHDICSCTLIEHLMFAFSFQINIKAVKCFSIQTA